MHTKRCERGAIERVVKTKHAKGTVSAHELHWRIHCGVEVTELSTNKQHTLSTKHSKGKVSAHELQVNEVGLDFQLYFVIQLEMGKYECTKRQEIWRMY